MSDGCSRAGAGGVIRGTLGVNSHAGSDLTALLFAPALNAEVVETLACKSNEYLCP